MSSMATNLRYPSKTRCFQLHRFEGQNDWRLWDLSVSSAGYFVVSGHHWKSGRTFIDLYFESEFSSTNKPKLIYSKEFDKYSENYRRCVSLLGKDVNNLVTSVGDKLEMIDFNRKRVTRSRRVNDTIRCLSVSEEQIITALGSSIVNIYNKSLSKMKSLSVEELPGIDQPDDMIVAAGKLYLCTQSQGRALSLRITNGNILTDFSPTTEEEPKAYSVAVSSQLHLLAVLWNQTQIAFYPPDASKSVLVTNLNHDVTKIRISDTGILVTGNERTGEVISYELIDSLFTYENMKGVWMALLQKEDCQKLIEYFTLSQDQRKSILQSDNSSEALLTALEEKGVLHHLNVNRMIEAFHSLKKGETSYLLASLYQKKRDIMYETMHLVSNVHSDCSPSEAQHEYCQRIFDNGDRMVTENKNTVEVQIRDMEDVSTYDSFKKKLGSLLKRQECVRLAEFFSVSKRVTTMIEKYDCPVEILFLALEGKGVLRESNVDRLTEAFRELQMQSSYNQLTEFYQQTRIYEEPTCDHTESYMLMSSHPEVKAADKPEQSSNTTKSLPTRQDMHLSPSRKTSEFLQESSFEGEFAKFSVRVSEKLSRPDCVKLATYFNLPASRIARIRNDFETPGITLFEIMKELHIINSHNVMILKEALEVIQLKDVSDTLVIPYQRNIDRLRFEQGYLSP